MFLFIADLIDKETVTRLQTWLAEAKFADGRKTAGADAAKVKNNEQVDSSDPQLADMQKLITDTLWDHQLFNMAVLPSRIRPPLFSRYWPGMTYGNHVDNALMSGMRTDVSMTLFLSDPADYDGGELVIDSTAGEQEIKLPPGSAVVYPTTALHRVAPVSRGQRLACVTWARSLVRDATAREILFDLETVLLKLAEQQGKTPEVDLISKSHANLLRMWAED
jgi:PKHD-type hydroxylase